MAAARLVGGFNSGVVVVSEPANRTTHRPVGIGAYSDQTRAAKPSDRLTSFSVRRRSQPNDPVPCDRNYGRRTASQLGVGPRLVQFGREVHHRRGAATSGWRSDASSPQASGAVPLSVALPPTKFDPREGGSGSRRLTPETLSVRPLAYSCSSRRTLLRGR